MTVMHQMSAPASPPAAVSPHAPLLAWFATTARDLPWRRAALRGDGWAVLVSEVMLQQTPVARVLPTYGSWMERWPAPADLASASPGDAVRAWGRLGYPRRALRLHAAARACVERYGGEVPRDVEELRTLPGVGPYTAAAVASFAYGARHAVLDTNVRRVLARMVAGAATAAGSAPSVAERRLAEAQLPDDPATAARWNAALMELGALVCSARSPDCASCPLAGACAWRLAGRPEATTTARRAQRYDGTDRQARGRLLAVLRERDPGSRGGDSVPRAELDAAWPDEAQRERALDSLVADGLVEPLPGNRFRLPRQPLG
jgi:A/G-specific adenine glycosylase